MEKLELEPGLLPQGNEDWQPEGCTCLEPDEFVKIWRCKDMVKEKYGPKKIVARRVGKWGRLVLWIGGGK